ncbi:hypothetical protein K435DRAFT_805432 [Dendrothele bispora CBS 962.96]|uniref:Uncharacterized protein n=1 Tax=Dendrothele bispora (strain CBS 962.96) TaxID=1314807 RepID=A0A4S8LB00_DENBC|nr:hypothetical protein K435DRAFT_805432 [Dendrothele bispora CBS 962.96]
MISIRVGMGQDKVYLATDSLVNDKHAMTHTETLSLPQFSPNRNVFTTTSSSSSSGSDSEISIDPEIIDASSGTASDGIIFPKKEESHNVSEPHRYRLKLQVSVKHTQTIDSSQSFARVVMIVDHTVGEFDRLSSKVCNFSDTYISMPRAYGII